MEWKSPVKETYHRQHFLFFLLVVKVSRKIVTGINDKNQPLPVDPLSDILVMYYPSGNQLPVPRVSTRQKEDQVIDWTRVEPRRADGASVLPQILFKRRDNKTVE